MRSWDVPGSAEVARPATNGTHRVAKRNGGAPKQRAGTTAPTDVAAPKQFAAPAALIEAAPIDAPMWPLHSAVWFQPDGVPSAPAWTGLAIEHHHRIPAPDFPPSDMAPVDCPGARESASGALTPAAAPRVPEDDLAPSGWDPRAVCGKEGGE